MTFQDTVTAARNEIKEHEVPEVPDDLLVGLRTQARKPVRVGYFDGREVTGRLKVAVQRVKGTDDYYLATITVHTEPEEYLVEVDSTSDLQETLLGIENIALQG